MKQPVVRKHLIEIHPGLINDVASLYEHIGNCGSQFAIITDSTVAQLYGDALKVNLSSCGLLVDLFHFPPGEHSKSRATKEKLEDALLEKNYGQESCILALGGGVVTDIAGYLAATYCRGVSLVMIPTTLLGMVDASIGGKNGVNVPYGKNRIGTYYLPDKILIDPHLLKSLPLSELKHGIVEMLKHGLIADGKHFAYLAHHQKSLLALESATITQGIYDSLSIKTAIVQEDLYSHGKRTILNFGHTVGHAIETLLSYTIPHGRAVAIGCLGEAHLSMQLGFLQLSDLNTILKVFRDFDLCLELPSLSMDALLSTMIFDKKSLQKKPRFVVLKEIGSPLPCGGAYCMRVEDHLIKNSLEWIEHALCCC